MSMCIDMCTEYTGCVHIITLMAALLSICRGHMQMACLLACTSDSAAPHGCADIVRSTADHFSITEEVCVSRAIMLLQHERHKR